MQTLIVPPPKSIKITPSSLSVSFSTEYADAKPAKTTPSTSMPTCVMHLAIFLRAVVAPVMMWVSTSILTPVMPTGSFIPLWESTTKYLGMTCRMSRDDGSEIARAASTTRVTSSGEISPLWSETATTPLEFWDSTWDPSTETNAVPMEYPAILSADSTDWAIEWTASSMSTTCPFRKPFAG